MIKNFWERDGIQIVKGFFRDLDFFILLNVALCVAATHFCIVYEIHLDGTATNILATVVIFPLAFSINAAYMRRQGM